MKIPLRVALPVLTVIGGLLIASGAHAAVFFTSDQSGGISAVPGSTVTFDLFLDVTGGEQVTGIDYKLTDVSGPGAGAFSITGVSGRNTSTFSFVNNDDATVGSNDILNPSSIDLGAGTTTGNAVSNGTYEVATYTLSIASNAALGTYNLSPTFASSLPNGDWIDANGNDNNLSQPLSVSVSVSAAPEPASWLLLLASFLVIPVAFLFLNKTVDNRTETHKLLLE